MSDKDDLKERLQLIAELSGRLTSSNVASIAKQAADRIAALEAKLAEKDALLRECGEALRALIQQCWECEKELTEELHRVDFCGESAPLCNARTTLAKIKDATDAD